MLLKEGVLGFLGISGLQSLWVREVVGFGIWSRPRLWVHCPNLHPKSSLCVDICIRICAHIVYEYIRVDTYIIIYIYTHT